MVFKNQDLEGLVNFWSEIPLCRMGMYVHQPYYNYKLILSEHSLELAFILKVRIFVYKRFMAIVCLLLSISILLVSVMKYLTSKS